MKRAIKKWTTSHENLRLAQFHYKNINLLRSSFWTPKSKVTVDCVYPYELKYNVANDTKEEELRIESAWTSTFNKTYLTNYFCKYIAQNHLFQKKDKANEIQRSQNIYFFVHHLRRYLYLYALWRESIALKCFLKMMFVLSGFLSLVHSSKTHKSKIVWTPGGVARKNSPKVSC